MFQGVFRKTLIRRIFGDGVHWKNSSACVYQSF